MKTKVKPGKIAIPTCSLLADRQKQSSRILSKEEIKVFNTFFYFLDTKKVSSYLSISQDYCSTLVASALIKLEYIYASKHLN